MSSTVAAREYRVRSISGSGSVSLANEGRGDWISRSVEAVGQWILARCQVLMARQRHQTHHRHSRNPYGSTGGKPASRTMPESRSCCILRVGRRRAAKARRSGRQIRRPFSPGLAYADRERSIMNESTSRTALITGASRGLGLALARRLAEDGWNLITDARGEEALEAARVELAETTRVVAICGDVTDAEHRRELAEAARTFGGLDALVNNASILGPSPQPVLLDYPVEVLEEVYRTNAVAPLALVQAVRQDLKPGARVVNVTSDAAVEPYEGWGGYGSSKAALEQLSNILAAENPELRVYRVDPSDMRTRMHQEAFPDEDISDRPPPEESVPGLVELLTGDLPSGRYEARALTQAREETV